MRAQRVHSPETLGMSVTAWDISIPLTVAARTCCPVTVTPNEQRLCLDPTTFAVAAIGWLIRT